MTRRTLGQEKIQDGYKFKQIEVEWVQEPKHKELYWKMHASAQSPACGGGSSFEEDNNTLYAPIQARTRVSMGTVP